MGLLEQAIREYLMDNHPEWRMTSLLGAMYIDPLDGRNCYVVIDPHAFKVSAYNLRFISNPPRLAFESCYDETIVLTLITESINSIEQQ